MNQLKNAVINVISNSTHMLHSHKFPSIEGHLCASEDYLYLSLV